MPELAPAYLISGDDDAKIAASRARLRARAEREAGPGSLELFAPGDSRKAPDADALIGALPALSLTTGRRYLLVDGAEAWSPTVSKRVAEALGAIPDDTTVVLIAHGKAPAALATAVKKAGGELLRFEAPRERELPRHLVADAARRGFELELDAAALLVERCGRSPMRLANELDRLALWAGEGGSVSLDGLTAMLADTSEEAIWSLADALTEGDAAAALAIAERLTGQGEAVTPLIYALAGRLRAAATAAAELDAGRTPKQVADGLSMHPYAAKMLVKRVGGRDPEDLRDAVGALADLELWCRGGSDYEEGVALTLALLRAAGEPAGAAANA